MVFNTRKDLYIACGADNRIRKIDSFGVITTIAGTGISGYAGDNGAATASFLHYPTGITLDSLDNIFFTDALNHVVRKINVATGIITTICGTGLAGYSGDGGVATAAKLYGPSGICFDNAGNLLVADLNNNAVRKINTSGIISTVAGTGVYGYNGDNIPATIAKLYLPVDVTVDIAGNIYVSDQGNYRIRKINSDGIISSYAGTGASSYGGNGTPATASHFTPTFIRFDKKGSLFISGDYRVSKIDNSGFFYTIAGNGSASNTGDGGQATAASLYAPTGLAFDDCNNLYVSLVNYNRIRLITFNPSPCQYLEVNGTENKTLRMYPNPTIDMLHIDNPSDGRYCIWSSVGVVESAGRLTSGRNNVSVETLPTGMYILEVTDKEGKRTITKFLKQ